MAHRIRRRDQARSRWNVIDRYAQWNRYAFGRPRSGITQAVYWYNDTLLFRGFQPVGRCFATPSGTVVLLLQPDFLNLWRINNFFDEALTFHVSTIGVAGPGCTMMRPRDLFNTLRKELKAQADLAVERVRVCNYATALNYRGAQESQGKPPGSRFDFWAWRQLQAYARNYEGLNELFCLGWEDFDYAGRRAEMDRIIDAKLKRHEDPDRVRARERKAARVEALEALGVKDGER
jgi:hypothetical protein